MSYAWESFSQAVRALASNETQRERLLRAYKMHLVQLKEKDIPAEIRNDFDRLVIDIRRCSIKDGGDLKRIAEHVGDHEVASMIDAVIRMYDAVTRYQPLPSPRMRSDAPVLAWPRQADGCNAVSSRAGSPSAARRAFTAHSTALFSVTDSAIHRRPLRSRNTAPNQPITMHEGSFLKGRIASDPEARLAGNRFEAQRRSPRPVCSYVECGAAMQAKNLSPVVRLRNYYRVFRPYSGRIKSLYFAFRLTW